MRRPAWPKKYPRIIFDKTNGKCFHCKKKIVFEQRIPKHGDQYWEIDHYPVQYVDIENQCCFKSHNFEKKYTYCCCIKSSQCPCKKINSCCIIS